MNLADNGTNVMFILDEEKIYSVFNLLQYLIAYGEKKMSFYRTNHF